MNGERKMPTITLMASADQLDPTFFRICFFSNFSMDGGCRALFQLRANNISGRDQDRGS
jgi:tRNA A37 threonylcarbamoyladenosine dehydratase